MQPEQQQRIMGYFIEEAKDHLNTIEQGLLNLQGTIDDPEMANEIFRAAHSVKGGAAMLGISSVQKTAHRLEDYFKILKEAKVTIDQKLESLFLRVFDTLQELLEQLEGPFGLTEDVASNKMTEVEPVFEQLKQHLDVLANESSAQKVATAASATSPDHSQLKAERRTERFSSEITTRLREMLQMFKQAENVATRQQLQTLCDELAEIGQSEGLDEWCRLVNFTNRAIKNSENSYRSLAPIAIKELKRAQEMILSGQGSSIKVPRALESLVLVESSDITASNDEFEEGFDDLLDLDEKSASETGGSNLDDDLFGIEPETTSANISDNDDIFAGIDDLGLPDYDDSSFPADADANDFSDIVVDSSPAPISKPAEPVGPEVGMAELNSLADLFEGEALDLDETWQEEEILHEQNDRANIESSLSSDDVGIANDFSDLLFDDEAANDLLLPDVNQQDLTSLLEDDFSEIDSQELGFPSVDENQSIDLGLSDMSPTLNPLLHKEQAADQHNLDRVVKEPNFTDELGNRRSQAEEVPSSSSLSELFEGLDESDLFPDNEQSTFSDISASEDVVNDSDDEFAGILLDDDEANEPGSVLDDTSLSDFSDPWGNHDTVADNVSAASDSLIASEEASELELKDDLFSADEESDSDESEVDIFLSGEDNVSASTDLNALADSDLDSLFSDISGIDEANTLSVDNSVENSQDILEEEASNGLLSDEYATVYQEILPDVQVVDECEEVELGALELDEALAIQEDEGDEVGGSSVLENLADEADDDLFGEADLFEEATENLGAEGFETKEADGHEMGVFETGGDVYDDIFGEGAQQMSEAVSGIEADENRIDVDDFPDLSTLESGSGEDEFSFTSDAASDLNNLFAGEGDDLDLGLDDSSTDDEEFSLDVASNDLDNLFAADGESDIDLSLPDASNEDWGSDTHSDGVSASEDISDLFAEAETDLDLGLLHEASEAVASDSEPLANVSSLVSESLQTGVDISSVSSDEVLVEESSSDDLLGGFGTDAELDFGLDALESSDDVVVDATSGDESLGVEEDLFANVEFDGTQSSGDELATEAIDDFSDEWQDDDDSSGFESSFLSDEAVVSEEGSEFDDLDSLLGDENDEAAVLEESSEFDDLDLLLGNDEAVVSEESSEFDDLDSLLGDEDDESAVVEEGSEFDDLDALLLDDSFGIASSSGDVVANVASDLDAAATNVSEDGGENEIDDGFGDLEKLLEDADQTMGGSPTAKSTPRSAQPITRRRRATFEQTMRVPVKNLDNLNNLVGELVVNRNSLEQGQERLRQFLDNLLHQVQQLSDVGQRMQDLYERSLLESSLLANRQSYRSHQTPEDSSPSVVHATGMNFDALEMDRFTGFHTLSQEMIEMIVRVREASSDIEFLVGETDQIARTFRQVTTQLQEGLTRSRMVQFSQAADRLPRAVRDIAIKCGKQGKLQIEGRDILIDKVIMEQLYDPMTHLVNNAITHGIEDPGERQRAGKPEVGTVAVRAFRQGNQTVISVSDDGGGIPVDTVKTKAIQKGLITSAEAKNMPDIEVYELLFHPGFSTKDQADDFSGRGVGMDVVRTSLSEIRGTISTDSEVGKGTTFTIRLPLTLSICKALCCISDRAQIAFPMDGVEDMLDVPRERIQENEEGQSCLLWRDNLLPFRPLTELLTYNRRLGRSSVYGATSEEDIISVVVLRSGGNFLALQVDRVLGEQEIVIKQLEGPVPKPVGVAGATVLGDGHIMPIADVLELIDLSMGRVRREGSGTLWERPDSVEPLEAVEVKSEPTVLIVDDSITVRELLSMTFNKSGYRVEQARDGQEAWEKLRSGLPCDIVFCDIEMPRMDGLELLSRLQKDATLSSLPIAMLTSRGADRHRQMAVQLGASGYFTKPYLEEALLDAAQRMLKGEILVHSKSEVPSS